MIVAFFCFLGINNLEEEKKNDHSPVLGSDLFLSYEEDSTLQEPVFIDSNSVMVSSSPYFVDAQVLGVGSEERRGIVSYKVKEKDTLESIAQEFEISKDTIKWANNITSDSVNIGDELLILPTTGVLYYVKQGDTLSEIAERHKASSKEIINFNDNIDEKGGISPGDQIIIPDGEKPRTITPQRPEIHSAGFSSVTYGTVTQGSHSGHSNAVDIANACGTPIYSAAPGTVTRVGTDPRMAGRYIWIDHGNMKALYAHMQNISVSSGQVVGSGQQIGTMGNTGYTLGATGCHLHFETRGASNPFGHMQRGQTMR